MIRIQRFQAYDLAAVVVLLSLFLLLWFTQPQYGKSKTKAGMSNCTGNLKQLGNAGALYEGDNAGTRPGPQPLGAGLVLVSWDRPLALQMGAAIKINEPVLKLTMDPPIPSVKTLATFICPDDHQRHGASPAAEPPGSLAAGTAEGAGICRSYALNRGSGNPAAGDGIETGASAIALAKIESGAGTVFLIESHAYATVFGQANIANDTTVVCSQAGVMVPADAFTCRRVSMHGIKSKPRFNALMYDGHVEALNQASVIANGGQWMQYHK